MPSRLPLFAVLVFSFHGRTRSRIHPDIRIALGTLSYSRFLKGAATGWGSAELGKFTGHHQLRGSVSRVSEVASQLGGRIDPVRLTRHDERALVCRGMTGPLGTDEQTGISPHHHRSHAALGVTARGIQSSGFGEPRQGAAALRRVVHRFAQTILRQHRVNSVVEPGLEVAQKRNGSHVSRHEPILIGEILDLPFDTEDFLVEQQRPIAPARLGEQIAPSRPPPRAR